MTTGNIRKADVADGIPVIIANATLEYFKNNTVLARLVRRDYDNEVAQAGDTVTITKLTGLTVQNKAAGTDYALDQLATDKVDVVLNKHKYVSFLIEDVAKFLAKPDYQQALVDEGVAKIAEQIDADLMALRSEVTTNSVGSAGVDMDADDLVDARKKLTDSKAPMVNRYAIISAKDAAALLKLEKFTSSNWNAENGAALVEANLGRRYGFDLFECQGVEESGTSPVSTWNLAFNKNAFALVTRPLGLPGDGSGVRAYYANADSLGLRVMMSYQHAKGGWMVTIDVLYGVKTVREELACKILT
jgi:hypothetical protein